MMLKTPSLAFAAACLTAIATMPARAQMAGTDGSTPGYNAPQNYAPQSNQGDGAQSASARRNVIQSQHYDRSLETNRAFRQARMRKGMWSDHGPRTPSKLPCELQARQPYMGSSTPRRGHRSEAGR